MSNDTGHGHLERLHTHDLELGVTDAIKRHVQRHVVDAPPVSQKRLDFEHSRPRWIREMIAEATGVFFYVYPGLASTAAFLINEANPAFGSMFQIGMAYAIGIAFAIITCGSTSGGHFNPAITIALACWQGFPWRKVPYYIFAQTFGAFLAACMIYGQYYEQLTAYKENLIAHHLPVVSSTGPSQVFAPYPLPTQNNQGFLFLIEFFVDSFLAVIIWSVLDPANPFVSASSAPFVIGLAYATMVWGFADITISTNLCRDFGTRLAAMMFYGTEAMTYKSYAWISVLVNIPATLFATFFYEMVLRDSLDKIGSGHAKHEEGDEGLVRHLTNRGMMNAADYEKA